MFGMIMKEIKKYNWKTLKDKYMEWKLLSWEAACWEYVQESGWMKK